VKVPVLNTVRRQAARTPIAYSGAGNAFSDTSGLERGLSMAATVANNIQDDKARAAAKLQSEQDRNESRAANIRARVDRQNEIAQNKADREQEKIDAKKQRIADKLEAHNEKEADRMRDFQAVTAYNAFEGDMNTRQIKMRAEMPVDEAAPAWKLISDFDQNWAKYSATLTPEKRTELGPRIEALRQNIRLQANVTELSFRKNYYTQELDKQHVAAKTELQAAPSADNLLKQQTKMYEAIDRSGLSPIDKEAKKKIVSQELQTISYGHAVKENGTLGPGAGKVMPGSAADNFIRVAHDDLGGDDQTALDLATLVSYETIGSFNPGIKGGKGGLYMGLIQFGPEERQKYGVTGQETFGEQLKIAARFLKDRGFKPGMGLLDMYSIVNAGSPGLYDRSDTPGMTVRSHVERMTNGPHRQKALALLNGSIDVGVLDKNPMFADVPAEYRAAAQDKALQEATTEAAAVTEQESQQYKTDFNSLRVGLEDGTLGESDYLAFREQHTGMGYEDVNSAKGILEQRAKTIAVEVGANNLLKSGAAWDPTDTDHKKYADALVGTKGLKAINAQDETYVTNTLTPIVERTGMVPSSIAGTLQGMLRQQNPQASKFALDTMSQLRDKYPRAFDALPDKLNNDLDLWNTAKGYMDQKTLMDLIKGSPSAEVRQAQIQLREQAKSLLRKVDDPNYVSFDKVVSSYSDWSYLFSKDPSIQGKADTKLMMQSEFNGLFEYEYSLDGNAKNASERAMKQLANVWSVSTLGGVSRIMKYPPEKQYRQVMGSHDWIDKQVRTEIKLMPDESYVLVGDAQTMQEVHRNKLVSGGESIKPNDKPAEIEPPSYTVVKIKDGVPTAYMNKDNKPYRIFFKVPEETVRQEILTINYEQQKAMDEDFASRFTAKNPRQSVHIPPEALKEMKARAERLKSLKEELDSYNKPTFLFEIPTVY
jgi:hypothetical protein